MNVDFESLDELFRLSDLEGLIAAGAPQDEYQPEVELIALALDEIPTGEASKEQIVQIFSDVWKKMFSTSEPGLAARKQGFEEIAEKLLTYFR